PAAPERHAAVPRRAVAGKAELALEARPGGSRRRRFDHGGVPRSERLPVAQARGDERLLAQRALEAPARGAAHRSEEIFAAQRIEAWVLGELHRTVPMHSSTQERRFARPRRTQVFTVPSGCARCLARSLWLMPRSYASTRAWRSCGRSSPRQSRSQ